LSILNSLRDANLARLALLHEAETRSTVNPVSQKKVA
jgi:hypothetical protein